MESEEVFLGLTTVALGYVAFLMIRPFIGYVLGALMLAFVLRPLHLKLRDKIGERISSFSLVVLAVLAAFLPFIITVSAVVTDAKDLQGDINSSEFANISELEEGVQELTRAEVDIEGAIGNSLKSFSSSTLGGASAILKKFTNFFIGFTLMLFLLYYLIKDGGKLLDWLKEVIPVEKELQEDYYSHLNFTTWAVVKGHVLVAIIQGVVAGLGLYVVGVPNHIFWTFIMVLLGFIPVIGTIVVWLPASVYLFLMGELTMALLLAVYGFTIVGATDNILRPLVVEREADLHPASIIVGVLGGLVVFGAVGMFIGPIIIGALKSIILVSKNR